jgi:hypothetical protein
MRFPIMLVLASVCAAACGDSAATAPADILLRTDSASYTASPIGYGQAQLSVIVTLRNSGSTAISLERCSSNSRTPMFGVELVRPSSSEGSGYNNGSWACTGIGPFEVAAGATRVDTLTLQGPGQYDNATGKYVGLLEGTFRINYFGSPSSNEFTIKLPASGIVPYVPRDLTSAIQTDSQLVHMRYRAPIYETIAPMHITMFNPRPDTSYIENCGGATGVGLEKQVGGAWVYAWSPAVPACLSPRILIPPNGHYEMPFAIYGATRSSNFSPKFGVDDVPGVYRLVWSQIYDARTGALVPVEQRRSNAFAIVVDR